ncbi:MAG: MerR family transcriptional regulator [Christensenellales bacterium]
MINTKVIEIKNGFMTVGELARQMGVTVRTLQYYDREGLLKPSALSSGGRRLYSPKDMIKLHQILSFKYLGFSLDEIKDRLLSLDTPREVAAVLEQQQTAVEQQIDSLQAAAGMLESLRSEVLRIDEVDFKKYAEIIELLRMGNKNYWVWKCLDKTLTDHIQERFMQRPELGERLIDTYRGLLDEALRLIQQNEPPDSEASMAFGKKWWDLIMEFTGGDMSLLPNLMEFNTDKSGWDEDIANKQKEIDPFMEAVLGQYFLKSGIEFPGMEQQL